MHLLPELHQMASAVVADGLCGLNVDTAEQQLEFDLVSEKVCGFFNGSRHAPAPGAHGVGDNEYDGFDDRVGFDDGRSVFQIVEIVLQTLLFHPLFQCPADSP